jgi:hypothetical protein
MGASDASSTAIPANPGPSNNALSGGPKETLKRLVKDFVYPITRIRPSLLILGAQKAGTTTLYEHLVTHPQVLPNRTWKEIRFFELPELYSKGFGSYLMNFPTRREARGRISLDASPSYLFFPHIAERIRKDLGSEIRMIALLRNPVDRAYSGWKMYHSFGTNENVAEFNRRLADRRTFAEAVDDELNGRTPPNNYPYAYVSRGLYADQIENYRRVFEQRNLLILDFRRLHNDLNQLLDEVTTFLEISPFTPDLKAQFQEVRYNRGLSRERSPEDEQAIERLRDFYRPHNARLEQLVGWSIDS